MAGTSTRVERLTNAINVIVGFVREVQTLRALRDAGVPAQTFWRVLNNSTFDMAVINWCKLFGSDDQAHQPTHWKNIAPDEQKFRNELLAAIGVSWSEWVSYRYEVKHYRDNSAAHHSVERKHIKTFPRYDLALKAALHYYAAAVHQIRVECGVPYEHPTLDQYMADFYEQALRSAQLATNATRSWAETVDFSIV